MSWVNFLYLYTCNLQVSEVQLIYNVYKIGNEMCEFIFMSTL